MDKTTIKQWFSKGKKPTEQQFHATFDSFRHIDDKINISEVQGLDAQLAQKASVLHQHTTSDIIGLMSTLAGKSDLNHTHSQSDIDGLQEAIANATNNKQDKTDNSLQTTVKTIVGAINELYGQVINLIDMASARSYTLDFGTGSEIIQDVNMFGSITINGIYMHNVSHLFVTYGSVSRQEITLSEPINIVIPYGTVISWEIVRTFDDELACVGVRCGINSLTT